jgi:hypothetical protein
MLSFRVQERDLHQASVSFSEETTFHAVRVTFFLLFCFSLLRTLIKLELDAENTNKNLAHIFLNYSLVSRWQICNFIASNTWDLSGLVESRHGVSTFLTGLWTHRSKLIPSFWKWLMVYCLTHLWHILRAHQHTPTHHTSCRCFVQTVTVELPAGLTYERLTWKITTTTLPSGQYM